jgi:mono/diheme cytochrome c family protein
VNNARQRTESDTRQAHIQGMAMLALALLLGVAGALWEIGSSTGPTTPLFASPSYQDIRQGKVGIPRARTGLIPASDNRGQVLFGRYCDSCHPAGQAGVGASLRDDQFRRQYTSAAQISEFVRKGGFDMPAYPPDFLPDEDLSAISQYVLSLSPEEQ